MLHCAPTGAIKVLNSILTGRNIAKALNAILRAQSDIGNQIVLVVPVIVVGKPCSNLNIFFMLTSKNIMS